MVGLIGCAHTPPEEFAPLPKCANPVADYMREAELQAETVAQKDNVKKALEDMVMLSLKSLKRQRYQDYQGNAGKWDLKTLIDRHFVPATRCSNFHEEFWSHINSPEVRRIVQDMLPLFPNVNSRLK
jgi:hypothetical protein